MNYLVKLKNFLLVLFTTHTVQGDLMRFHIVYCLYILERLFGKLSNTLGSKMRNWRNKHLGDEFVIRNSIGYFSIDPRNDSLTKSIANFEHTVQSWIDRPVQHRTMLDIGANIGFYSLLGVNKYGYKQVYAFEPNPPTHRRAADNVTLNNLQDITLLSPIALSNKSNTATLHTKAMHTGASSLSDFREEPGKESVLVPTDTFDHFAQEHYIDISQVDMIKIDVEGHEEAVLQGMKHSIPLLHPGSFLFIEIDPHNTARVQSLLEEYGFALVESTAQHNYLYCKN